MFAVQSLKIEFLLEKINANVLLTRNVCKTGLIRGIDSPIYLFFMDSFNFSIIFLVKNDTKSQSNEGYMYKIVLIRHGESIWNKENRFTGWTDVDLSEKGISEAKIAGDLLREEGYVFDKAFTSVLARANHTLSLVLERMSLSAIHVERSWRLNERHYGALQGLDKRETARIHGDAQVKIWRRAYDIAPPPLTASDPRFPGNDPLYADVPRDSLPYTECLKDTVNRVLPYWNTSIVPAIRGGQRVIIAAHGNSLRALVKYLDHISNAEIVELNIPTGIPLVYELDSDLHPIRNYYLGDPDTIAAAAAAVANQGKA